MRNLILIALTAIMALFVACGPKEDPLVEVTSVSLSQTTLSIAKGGTTTLTATVGPHNATDKTVQLQLFCRHCGQGYCERDSGRNSHNHRDSERQDGDMRGHGDT